MHRFAFVIALSSAVAVMVAMPSFLGASDQLERLLQQARTAAGQGKHAQAVEFFDQAIALDATQAGIFRLRGQEQFCSGNIEASIKDFDQVARLAPNLEKTLWERGISHYYAGRFDEGAKQFELYQTYHDADVENATWRYLCVARAEDLDKARDSLLPIKNDRRIPMMEIYRMYQGHAKPDDVLSAAKAGSPSEVELNQRLFYAHLYIGLYLEAAGEHAGARKHIAAAVDHPIGHYMHDVARVHLSRLAAKDE